VRVEQSGSAVIGRDTVVRDFVQGVFARSGSVQAHGVISESDSSGGFSASLNGVIASDNAIARGNAGRGFLRADSGGAIHALNGATEDGNGGHNLATPPSPS